LIGHIIFDSQVNATPVYDIESPAKPRCDPDEWLSTSDDANQGLIDVNHDRREDFPQSFMQVVAAEALNHAIPAVVLGVPVWASVPKGPMGLSWVVLSPQTSSIEVKTRKIMDHHHTHLIRTVKSATPHTKGTPPSSYSRESILEKSQIQGSGISSAMGRDRQPDSAREVDRNLRQHV
jgi:hypothetical protein